LGKEILVCWFYPLSNICCYRYACVSSWSYIDILLLHFAPHIEVYWCAFKSWIHNNWRPSHHGERGELVKWIWWVQSETLISYSKVKINGYIRLKYACDIDAIKGCW